VIFSYIAAFSVFLHFEPLLLYIRECAFFYQINPLTLNFSTPSLYPYHPTQESFTMISVEITPPTPSILLDYNQRIGELHISPCFYENAPSWLQDALQTLLERLPDLLAPFWHEPVSARLAASIISTIRGALCQLHTETMVEIGLDTGNLEETMVRAVPTYRADR
jgi:hypothetical protein